MSPGVVTVVGGTQWGGPVPPFSRQKTVEKKCTKDFCGEKQWSGGSKKDEEVYLHHLVDDTRISQFVVCDVHLD